MRKRIIGGAFITAAAAIAFQLPHEVNNPEVEAGQVPVTLVDTVDGDTIKVRLNGKAETVRYLLVDTPESKKPGMCVQPYAKEAYIRNDELVKAGRLTMEFEKGETRDSYGRLLAYVYVDGASVQEKLLQEGFARVAYIMDPPYKYLNLFRNEEKTAKEKHLNIWSRIGYATYKGFVGCERSKDEVNQQRDK